MVGKRLINSNDAAAGIVPSENFNTVLYTGDGTTGRSITTGLAADLVIIKNRSSSQQDWIWFDIIRGPSEYIRSTSTSQQYNAGSGQGVSAFGSTTVTIGDNAAGNLGANGSVGGTYSGAALHVMYAFTGGGAAVSNTDGSITSQVSANVDAGFSISTFTSNASTLTAGHGLNSTPDLIIVKATSFADSWFVNSIGLTNRTDRALRLNQTSAEETNSVFWNNTAPTSTTFSLGSGVSVSGNSYVAYCFHSVDGYSKIGSYTGNAGSNPITTGFRPAFLMIKRSNNSGSWLVLDNKRETSNPRHTYLFPNSTSNESVVSSSLGYDVDFDDNGFELKGNGGDVNTSGGEYIFMAFAE